MKSKKTDNWYSERDVSSTFIKGLRVLSAFQASRSRLTLPEIGDATGFDRATVRRLVATLVESGHVRKHARHFTLTPTVLAFAGCYLRSNGIGTVVQPILDKFSDLLKLQVSFAQLAGDSVIYVAQSHNKKSVVSLGFTIGSRLPVIHTALGRALLAYEDKAVASSLIETAELKQYCADTKMDRKAIGQEIETIREQGYAIVTSEFENGIAGISVPVGHLDACKGVVGISHPVGEVKDEKLKEQCIVGLQSCAKEINNNWVGPD